MPCCQQTRSVTPPLKPLLSPRANWELPRRQKDEGPLQSATRAGKCRALARHLRTHTHLNGAKHVHTHTHTCAWLSLHPSIVDALGIDVCAGAQQALQQALGQRARRVKLLGRGWFPQLKNKVSTPPRGWLPQLKNKVSNSCQECQEGGFHSGVRWVCNGSAVTSTLLTQQCCTAARPPSNGWAQASSAQVGHTDQAGRPPPHPTFCRLHG